MFGFVSTPQSTLLSNAKLDISSLQIDIMPVMSSFSGVAVCLLGILLFAQVRSSAAHILDIEPAVAIVTETEAAGAPLQNAERQQLTDDVVSRISSDKSTAEYASYFAFEDSPVSNANSRSTTAPCKSFPGDSDWPSDDVWDVFGHLLGKALIPTRPMGAPCYDSEWGEKDETECANIIKNSTNADFLSADPTANYWPIFEGRTCQPKNDTSGSQCTIGGYPEYAVKITNVAQVQLAINFARAANLRLVIKNTGHCYLGKSLGAGALSLWMHNMKDIDFLPDYKGPGYSGPALKLAAGVSVREVYEAADKHGVTVLGAVSWVSSSPSIPISRFDTNYVTECGICWWHDHWRRPKPAGWHVRHGC